MDDQELADLKRESLRILHGYILDPEVLKKGCLLDFGRHNLQPKHDLGALKKLPLELLHQVLGDIDVQSLLTFRRVNQSAMTIVDSMVDYKKLLPKLYQKHCDGDKCGKLAPYVDVFGPTRRCLSIGRGCRSPCGPLFSNLVMEKPKLPLCPLPTRTFRAIPGDYGKHMWEGTMYHGIENCDYLYDYREPKQALLCDHTKATFEDFGANPAERDFFWKLCSVAVPWLSKQGTTTETGVFCEICSVNDEDGVGYRAAHQLDPDGSPSIRQAKGQHNVLFDSPGYSCQIPSG
ncbi:hypothetical protein DE146DRAFT_629598 [Phaeosphaeria sp. MPI-PUGE-AT-0046c]|nr:hypothetical protein DE146DRAFT_629598 [Phaeosphaeria sp. MPI-PUGE-AT-0046c]